MGFSGKFKASIVVLLLTISGCGGGGGGSSTELSPQQPIPPPGTPPVSADPTRDDLIQASRMASHATFGLDYQDIYSMAEQGIEDWLDEQFDMPYSSHVKIAADLMRRREAGEFEGFEEGVQFKIVFWRVAWWNRVMTAEDQLRQRVAFALSEIFVISDIDILRDHPYAITSYNDMLLDGAFGNFQRLLRNVALHPAMGNYLSHINNHKAIPEDNIFPDENFAREVMQLFSIGLHELEIDGTVRTDSEGRPIPAYDNDDIHELAKVFTGLSYGGDPSYFGRVWPPFFRSQMKMFEHAHTQGEKYLLNGQVVPDGQTGMEDIADGIENLFNHPNVGPFICKQLIQRLVTSNPSPEYVARVARAFNGDATGVRGDMKAVIKAVLLDPEALNPTNPATFGKLREPIIRLAALARQFNATSEDGMFFNNGYRLNYYTNQHPYSAPSVFNFFLPSHMPAGELAANGLVAPEFQITNSSTIIGMTNQLDVGIFSFHKGELLFSYWAPFTKTEINIGDYVALAEDPEELLDRLDIVLTYGRLSDGTRQAILGILRDISGMQDRVEHAIYLMTLSPDYAVET